MIFLNPKETLTSTLNTLEGLIDPKQTTKNIFLNALLMYLNSNDVKFKRENSYISNLLFQSYIQSQKYDLLRYN